MATFIKSVELCKPIYLSEFSGEAPVLGCAVLASFLCMLLDILSHLS